MSEFQICTFHIHILCQLKENYLNLETKTQYDSKYLVSVCSIRNVLVSVYSVSVPCNSILGLPYFYLHIEK